MKDFYPIYLVNIKDKTYETFYCDSPTERNMVEEAARAMESLFDIDIFCIKYVEPEFDEE